MKKDISYREQLLELSRLYKVPEIKSYLKSKKNLTTSQLELILIKNKIPLPVQSQTRKVVAKLKFREQLITNLVLTVALLGFITSLIGIRPYIKVVTDEIKFTHVAREYKSNFNEQNKVLKSVKDKKKVNLDDEDISLDTRVTLNLFEDLKYDLKSIRTGALVKPIYLSKLPKDLKKIKSTKTKKDTFIKIVMPLILDENNKILENRKKLFKILAKPNNTRGEKVWLKRRFEDYGIKNEDVTELKIRMDIIPASIAIAQAAKESGWGTSRFALEGNAMFGQWTGGKKGIAPLDREENKGHKILKFPILRSSVQAYKNNLNTHKGYKEFREKRAEFRKKNKKISGVELVQYLHNYAATGSEYTRILKKIIDQNQLTDFDAAVLMNSNQSSTLTL